MEKRVGVRQFKNDASRIVREVREERAEYVITVDGEPAAKLIPVTAEETPAERKERIRRYMAEVEQLAKKVGAAWTSPLTAAEQVAEQRREL